MFVKENLTQKTTTILHKGFDISALSFHRVMQVLYKNEAMNQWGSIVALTYMAAQRVFQITTIWQTTRLI